MRTLVALLSLLLTVHTEGNSSGHSWKYPDGTGNGAWSNNFPNCAGKKQSPIDIQTNKLLENKLLEPLVLSGYKAQEGHFPMINNGHSVQLTLPADMHIIEGLPYKFTAVQLHFHWRSTTQPHGSEHTINGEPSDCELHVVHFNSEKYKSFEEAQDKPDGLAVIAVLIKAKENEENTYYEPFFSYLSKIQNAGENVTLPSIDVQHMLPCNLKRYYRYYGSLTTPPCTENVIWTVLTEHVFISTGQLHKLFSLKDNFSHSLENNFRHVQPLNGRIVEASFPPEEAEDEEIKTEVEFPRIKKVVSLVIFELIFLIPYISDYIYIYLFFFLNILILLKRKSICSLLKVRGTVLEAI